MRVLLAGAVPVLAILLLGAAFAETPEDNDRLCSGDNDEVAVAACTAVIQADQQQVGDVAEALNKRGHAYFNLDQIDRAIEDFDQAIKLDPNNVQALYNRGIANFKIHQTERSIKDFDQAIKRDPKNTYAFTNRGVVYADDGQYGRALQDFDRAIDLDPNTANALFNRGLVKQRNGDTAGASVDIARARQMERSINGSAHSGGAQASP